MLYTIKHRTSYNYFEPVSQCYNIARLIPRNTGGQFYISSRIVIDPEPTVLNEYQDFFGNTVIYFSVETEHSRLVVDVQTTVEKTSVNAGQQHLFSQATREEIIQELHSPDEGRAEIRQFVFATPMTIWDADIADYAAVSYTPGRPVFDATLELMGRIHTDFSFKPGITTIATPVSEVMRERRGVCQDFAHVAIACIRSVGLPVRYVSGYIETISPKGKEKLVGADASHAWFSVYIPPLGWVEFDPTNNMIPGDRHIIIGWGRDYADIAPFRGIILSSGKHELAVAVDVLRET